MSVLVDQGRLSTGAVVPRGRRDTADLAGPDAPLVPERREPRVRTRPPARVRPRGGRARVPVTACALDRQRRQWPLLAAVGLAMCLLVVGFGLLAGAAAASDVPTATTTVAVAPGETLWDVATDYAPASDPGAVVDRIQELNGLEGASVEPGLPLAVPCGGGAVCAVG